MSAPIRDSGNKRSDRPRCRVRSPLARVALFLTLLSSSPAAAEQEYRLFSPPGHAVHPAVLFVPGCSGFNAGSALNHYQQRAAELQAAGYAVLFVDYVGRRMQTNCAHVSMTEVAADVMEAADWLRHQPKIDPGAISVIGWSYGGGGILAALQAMPRDPSIAKAVMYYPVCRGARAWTTQISALMLLGGKDDIAYPNLCKPVIDGVPADRLHVITYPDARHGFDISGFQGNPDQPGAPVYNADAAEASWTAVRNFLKSPRPDTQ
jgi:dienelactone hydrolase